MSEDDFPRSNSPSLPAKNSDFQVDEEGRYVEVVPCTICGRKFAVDRIQTHANICSHQKERKPYDVAMMRVSGTEAEELVRNGEFYFFIVDELSFLRKGIALNNNNTFPFCN
jgi:hypothetical protein